MRPAGMTDSMDLARTRTPSRNAKRTSGFNSAAQAQDDIQQGYQMPHENIKTAFDIGAVGTAGATLLGWLPHLASILSIIWLAIRIYETDTVRRLLGRKSDG
jgi:hypothetical protein